MPLYMQNREDIRSLDDSPLPANTPSTGSIFNRGSGNASNPNRILNLMEKHKAEVRSRMTNPEQGLEAILRERQSTYNRRSSNAYTPQNPKEAQLFDDAINGRSSESIRRPSTRIAPPESLRYGVSAAGAVNERTCSEDRYYIPYEIEIDDDVLPSVWNQVRFQPNQDVVVAPCIPSGTEEDDDDDTPDSRKNAVPVNRKKDKPGERQATKKGTKGRHNHGHGAKSPMDMPPDNDHDSPGGTSPSQAPDQSEHYRIGEHRKRGAPSHADGPSEKTQRTRRKKDVTETDKNVQSDNDNEDPYEPEPRQRTRNANRNSEPSTTIGSILADYKYWILAVVLLILGLGILYFVKNPIKRSSVKEKEGWETPIMYHEPIF